MASPKQLERHCGHSARREGSVAPYSLSIERVRSGRPLTIGISHADCPNRAGWICGSA